MVFVSSEFYVGGRFWLGDFEDIKKSGYGDSKFYNIILVKVFVRVW